MIRHGIALASLGLFFVAAACSDEPQPVTPQPPAPPPPVTAAPPPTAPAPVATKVSLADVGLDAAALDKSADPCTDFYQFACGSWIKNTPIPADKPLYSRSFSVIADRNEAMLHDILEDAAKAKSDDPATKKIGAYYAACMDEAAADKAGAKPLKPLLAAVNKVHDPKSLEAAIVELHQHGVWALFDVSDEQDFKDATKMIAEVDQNGLGLPNKNYYKPDDAKGKETLEKYKEHVERMLALAGFSKPQAKKGAEHVVNLESAIAEVSKAPRERRDPKAMYNRVDRDGLQKLTPHFDWAAYFKGVGFPDITSITITSPHYFEGIDKIIDTTKPDAWKAYLTYHVARAYAAALSKPFVDEGFAMEQVLTGQKEQKPRWKRCVAATDRALGELVAQPYVKKAFTPDSKASVERYFAAISQAFRDDLGKIDWMDQATKDRAAQKLAAMEYLIGYPSKWRSYDFDVKPTSYAENAMAAKKFDLAWHLGKIGKPVDRAEWGMSPPTVNAYYRPTMNHMVFPAGILQPPFYSAKANIPVNLGGLGMVVGHEMSHGFDDQGAQFDEKGNLADWWSPGVGDKFNAKTQCVSDQYAGYDVNGLHLDGKLTLGENVADNVGIKLAFAAYRSLRKGAPEVLVADGFTEDQQFFLGAAQSWCQVTSDDFLRMQIKTNPHSPAKFRINGPLSNLSEFSDAFACKQGAPMRRQGACSVW